MLIPLYGLNQIIVGTILFALISLLWIEQFSFLHYGMIVGIFALFLFLMHLFAGFIQLNNNL